MRYGHSINLQVFSFHVTYWKITAKKEVLIFMFLESGEHEGWEKLVSYFKIQLFFIFAPPPTNEMRMKH